MPAKSIREPDQKACLHIYNRGVEGREIFADPADYQAFLKFLEDYLTALDKREVVKKEFTVNGRVFKGVPHQPKNYFGKVELKAYSLKSDHFHLLLLEKTKGAMESFLRSLLTRYSIYFNKKYSRGGALFGGRYKSAEVKDVPSVSLLTRYFHLERGQSSYPEYLGQRETPWLKVEVEKEYQDFVEKHQLDHEEKQLLARIVLENSEQTSQVPKPLIEESRQSRFRVPEFIVATTTFGVLLFLGVTNIQTTQANQAVLSAKTEAPQEVEVQEVLEVKEEPKKIVAVKTEDGVTKVNIREAADTEAKIMGKAKDGDEFEYVNKDAGWYEVKLADEAIGFIAAEFVAEEEER